VGEATSELGRLFNGDGRPLPGSWMRERSTEMRTPEYLGDPTKHCGSVSQGVGRVSRVARRGLRSGVVALPSMRLAVPRTFIGSPTTFERTPDHRCVASQHLGRHSRASMWGLPAPWEALPSVLKGASREVPANLAGSGGACSLTHGDAPGWHAKVWPIDKSHQAPRPASAQSESCRQPKQYWWKGVRSGNTAQVLVGSWHGT
jgi:hypothetical protein